MLTSYLTRLTVLGEAKKILHGHQARHEGKKIVFVTRKAYVEGFETTINLTLVDKHNCHTQTKCTKT